MKKEWFRCRGSRGFRPRHRTAAGLQAAALLLVSLWAASVASAATIVTVVVSEGDSLFDGSTYTSGEEYLVAFQLTGGTTSNSLVNVTGIDLGGGSASASSISAYNATYDSHGLPDGSLALQITPMDGYAYFLQNLVAGAELQFTATLNGIYSPPLPDAFSFQLYSSNAGLVYEQVFNLTNASSGGAPTSAPEPSTLLVSLGGILLLVGAKRRMRRTQLT